MSKRVLLTLSSLFIFLQSFSQHGLERWDTLKVTKNGTELKHAWSGGVNSPQFSSIDLNSDGIKDLFIFDRACNRVLTFINKGTANTEDYHYDRLYEKDFPPLHDFALLADYNCDGREDLYTYSGSGMSVYRNEYSIAGGRNWVKMTHVLMETFGANLVNIYVASSNIPALADLDNDGDLDILSLAVPGSFVEYHKNMSMELYGHCDSLAYAYEESCWGNFTLSSASNTATLGASCRSNGPSALYPEDAAHAAATMLAIDLDGDGAKELIVGDIGFTNLLMLKNGGTPSAANMIAIDTQFPSNNLSSIPVNLSLFPAAYYLDIDNDGKKDLVVANNAPSVSENAKGTWFYKNNGTTPSPDFEIVHDSLLQNHMIETGQGNHPVFFDQDGDGIKDLFMGNYGFYNSSGIYTSSLTHYKNIGTLALPKFQFMTSNFAGTASLSLQGLYPAFGDLDSDGDEDLILGESEGTLVLYFNTAGAGNPANFVLSTTNYAGIDVGGMAAPQIIDLDNDGKKDLAIGRRNGMISFYKNTGTNSNAVFSSTPTNSFLGEVNVVNAAVSITGLATPFFGDFNGARMLFVGSERGYVYLYKNIDGNLNSAYTLIDSTWLDQRDGCLLSVSGGDLDGDGKVDLVIGNEGGGCVIYRNVSFTGLENYPAVPHDFLGIYPNPGDQYVKVELGNLGDDFGILELYSVTGKLLNTFICNSPIQQINTETLESGMYFCKHIGSNSVRTGKFLIVH